jgi:hypothetical protein
MVWMADLGELWSATGSNTCSDFETCLRPCVIQLYWKIPESQSEAVRDARCPYESVYVAGQKEKGTKIWRTALVNSGHIWTSSSA